MRFVVLYFSMAHAKPFRISVAWEAPRDALLVYATFLNGPSRTAPARGDTLVP